MTTGLNALAVWVAREEVKAINREEAVDGMLITILRFDSSS